MCVCVCVAGPARPAVDERRRNGSVQYEAAPRHGLPASLLPSTLLPSAPSPCPAAPVPSRLPHRAHLGRPLRRLPGQSRVVHGSCAPLRHWPVAPECDRNWGLPLAVWQCQTHCRLVPLYDLIAWRHHGTAWSPWLSRRSHHPPTQPSRWRQSDGKSLNTLVKNSVTVSLKFIPTCE